MTEAERFLKEKLNPTRSVATSSPALQRPTAKEGESDRGWGVLCAPAFSEHRKFWFAGFILLLFLANLLVADASGLSRMLDHHPDDDDISALCFLMVTPITFWIPSLCLVYWAFGRKVLQVIGWLSSVWMVCVQLFRLFILFNMRHIDLTDIVVGIVVAILGFLGMAAIVRNLIVQKAREENPVARTGKHQSPPKSLRVKYVCPSCKKTVRSLVPAVASATTRCPNCGNEIAVSGLAAYAKEPIPAQLAQVIFYIIGILSIGFGIAKFLSGRFSADYAFVIGEMIGAIGIPVLFYSLARGIRQGRTWVRILLLLFSALTVVIWVMFMVATRAFMTMPIAILAFMTILPTAFVFLPHCNDWFALKRICRKCIRERKSS